MSRASSCSDHVSLPFFASFARRFARCTARAWWCVKATAADSFTWSVSASRPYLKADSPARNVKMVSELEPICHRSFITSAAGLFHSSALPGNHPCFSCKAVGREVARCSVSGCGRYYHEDCVQNLPGTTCNPSGGFSCPQHSCSTCCLERDLQRACKGKANDDHTVHEHSYKRFLVFVRIFSHEE